MIYVCQACGAERERAEVVAVASPSGAGWFCRDLKACREWREPK